MKIKRTNTVVAVLFVLVGATAIQYMTRNTQQESSFVANHNLQTQVNEVANDLDAQSISVPRNATIVPWVSKSVEISNEVKLYKWQAGDRIYYRVVAPGVLPLKDAENGQTYSACQVYLPRQDASYDEWIIDRYGGRIHHYRKQSATDDGREAVGTSVLPVDRYRFETNPETGQVEVVFWCPDTDTPGNIVVRYSLGMGHFTYATTSRQPSLANWDNHRGDRWSFP